LTEQMEKGHNSLMRLGIIFVADKVCFSTQKSIFLYVDITNKENSSCIKKFSSNIPLPGVTLKIIVDYKKNIK